MRKLICTIFAATGLALTGCAGNMGTPNTSGSSTSAQAVPKVDMAQIKTSVIRAQNSITNVQSLLGQFINPDGSLNFSALLGGVNFGDLSQCVNAQFQPNQLLFLPQDIANALSCLLNDVVTVAKAAKTDMSTAMNQLTQALANVPAGSVEAVEIQAMIDQINQFQTQYVTLVHSLAQQISLASQFLSGLPALATGVCPIPVPGLTMICGAAVSVLLQPIQNAITNFQVSMATL